MSNGKEAKPERLLAGRDYLERHENEQGNLTDRHKAAIRLIRSGIVPIALVSAFVNGEPTAALAIVFPQENDVEIIPEFVAVTPGMEICDHDGRRASEDGTSGSIGPTTGPTYTQLREFAEAIARLLKDGESAPGVSPGDEKDELTSDDAVETLHGLIDKARLMLTLMPQSLNS